MWGLLAAPIIKGIAGIFAGKAKAKAQTEAAKIQSAAADKVAGINTGVYQQQMAGMEPYAALGRQSANTLGRLMTPGVPYSPMQQLADARAQQASLPPWAMNPGAAAATTAVDRAQPARAGQLGALAQGMVQMRAPNGSVRAIPAAQVDEFMRKGAVRV